MPNRPKTSINTDETLLIRYEETKARMQKYKFAGYTVVSMWVCEFRKLLREKNIGLENELSSHPYLKNFYEYSGSFVRR